MPPLQLAYSTCQHGSDRPTVSKVRTEPSELPIGNRLREYAVFQHLEQIPLPGAALGLEVPEDPALGLRLESIQLCLNVLAHFVFPRVAPVPDFPAEIRLPAPARSHPPTVGKGTLVAGSRFETVEMGSTVGHCARPLADHHPLVRGGPVVGRRADSLEVLLRRPGDLVRIEDLILVVIDDDVLRVVVRRREEVV